MIVIFEKDATKFDNLGLGVLNPTKCIVREELNGIYELELVQQIDNSNKFKLFQNERIILAKTPTGYQPFRIYRISPDLEAITVNAQHIFYDLLNNFVENATITGTPKEILQQLVYKFAYQTNFKFTTNLIGNGTVIIDKENPISAFLNEDKEKPKFLQVFSGEVNRDVFNIDFLANIGIDRGYTIRYGKNLTNLKIEEDYSNVVTRLYAYSNNGLATIVDSDKINDYQFAKIGTESFTANSLEELQKLAEEYLKTLETPSINITVNFVLLSQTEEYKDLQFLEEIRLGDTVSIYNEILDFRKKAKVISYTYDCLEENYIEIELGDFKEILTNTITTTKTAISSFTTGDNSLTTISSKLDNLISSLNQKIRINTDNILILDNVDEKLAQTVVKIDITGIKKSTNGINGSYTDILNF